jgi:hypothetical protein
MLQAPHTFSGTILTAVFSNLGLVQANIRHNYRSDTPQEVQFTGAAGSGKVSAGAAVQNGKGRQLVKGKSRQQELSIEAHREQQRIPTGLIRITSGKATKVRKLHEV